MARSGCCRWLPQRQSCGVLPVCWVAGVGESRVTKALTSGKVSTGLQKREGEPQTAASSIRRRLLTEGLHRADETLADLRALGGRKTMKQ